MSPTKISYTLVDAFATGPFTGNQAAVVVTEEPLSSELMQKIAAEFNLAETAYVVPKSASDPSAYSLKWFTPDNEEKLCGHATLATAHVITNLPTTTSVQSFTFDSLSGLLRAEKTDDGLLELDFPADTVTVIEGAEREKIEKAAVASMHGKGSVKGVYRGNHDVAIEVVMNDGVDLADLDVDHNALAGLSGRGVILTTETGNADGPRFHSRFLCPGWTLVEDSVTGSAHCLLGVIYAPRFDAVGKPITATQGGKRRGQIAVVWDGKEGKDGGRMKLRGKTVTVAKGTLYV